MASQLVPQGYSLRQIVLLRLGRYWMLSQHLLLEPGLTWLCWENSRTDSVCCHGVTRRLGGVGFL